ncbi:hypothetical protein [Novipirellula sp.]|uniref:hypothetical protein n=1 Tax=Novipirellula sp. TaxID=2795430 RepID=UPI00356191D1
MKRSLAIVFFFCCNDLTGFRADRVGCRLFPSARGGGHGRHASRSHRGYGYPHNGHGHSSHPGYGSYSYSPSYQYGANDVGRSSRYPAYSQGYRQGYGGRRHYGQGGELHLDIGRFHLGLGDHH